MNLKVQAWADAEWVDLKDSSAWLFVGGPWEETDGAWAPAAPPPTAGANHAPCFRIAWAALWPGPPVTEPHGCVPEPHSHRPSSGAR